MATSKLDYLKKYMDADSQNGTDKVKKKKKKHGGKKLHNIKVFDAQADYKSFDKDDTHDEQFDLIEEKPVLFAEDGATIFTKEYEEKELKKKTNWKTVESNKNTNKKRHDSSGDDLSPPRAAPRRKRHDSDASDMSPPRNRKKRHDSSGSDISPVRKNQPRRKRHDSSGSDFSPVRTKQDDDSDLSPQRMQARSDSDFSPERPSSKKNSKGKRSEIKPEIVKKAGLQSASELRKENEMRRLQEKEKFKKLDKETSGRGAETVHRDRSSGKKIDVKLEALKKRREEEQKFEEREKHAVWGRGVAQEKEHAKKLEDALHEISKPLARYKDDKDLDSLLKAQDREGDPMAAYMAKKKAKPLKNQPSKPTYKGPKPAPNRFNIMPGFRYDGVDRSNGFEKERFATINKMKTFKEAKHKWSVEDM
ncbi:BUD13 homolog [Clytia hemisphaerica]|uniref:BUD13 homolog n=1 Tax=Clytia hemisphaerica TaxID=252671 RepID=A0A7M6DNR7_9CNID